MTSLADTIAATLAEHDYVPNSADVWRCLCGWTMNDGGWWHPDAHRAHLAAVLAEQEAQRRKADRKWWGDER